MLHHFDRRVRLSRASATILIAALAACATEDTTSPPRPAAPAPAAEATVVSQDSSRLMLTNQFAYVLADQPTSPSYRPNPRYSYNAFGSGTWIVRLSAGSYEVRIDSTGWGRALGFAATAHGSSSVQCGVSVYSTFPSFMRIRVSCYDTRTLAATDSRFTLLVVGRGALNPRSAFAFANQPSAALYTPNPLTSYTSGPDSMWIRHGPTVGSYTVSVGTGSPGGSTFLVHAQAGTHNVCKVGPWHTYNVQVSCFDATGAPADARYFVLQVERGRNNRRLGFAWVDQPTAPLGVAYTPNIGFSHNSSGGAISAVRNAVGQYVVRFEGLVKLPGHTENVQVGSFGATSTACRVVNWMNSGSALDVRVDCRRLTTGILVDARFNVLVIE